MSKGVFQEVAGTRPAPKVGKKHTQETIGLDSMVGKAWDIIMKPERRRLGIYGMGGVGKTTLLTRINNKFKDEFDVVIWVVVSKDLQYDGIQDQILRRLRVDREWEGEREDGKASSIANILGRKKFVLLLNDLWSELDLDKIGVPHPTQENGSKIVFNTRSEEVCKCMNADDEMKIDCLSTNEAWELFQNAVGEDPLKKHPDIPKIAKQICEKCYGLPLALNVIGKAMSCKENVHEWRHANKVLNTSSHHEFPSMEEKILSVLKFSYDRLETEKKKSCFLYCSLFQEDYEIKKEELIEYWISEEFIKGERDEDGSNNEGYDIIGSLVRAHLLMECETKSSFFQIGFTPAVKMHDVLREMALWIGKEEEKQCVNSGGKLSCIPDDINWSVFRRISLMSKFFQFMPSLVVLNLSRNEYLSEWPEEIYSLISLQYLNLSRKGTSLPNLQVLKLYCSCVFIDARSIEELQLLEHLKILTVNVKDALMLESIQGMERLARCVQRLLDFGYVRREIKIDWKSKEKEDLLCNSSPYFRHLSSIAIYDLEDPKELTWLLFAPNLKHLHVTSSGRIEEIINKEKGMSISNVHPDLTVPFAKLESLRLRGLNELKRICSSPPALPSLKNIVVEYCRKLPKAATESFQDTIKNNEDAE
ncbi:hypothetical protein DY000_02059106 [Brassica cretica]|uniref:NB-ARC domain-containing protein n=1 Tax=Brassica cretica TaxID=69181 RepID=A0ABQ7B417_BRACR|nr:hypothetical protein DY000_02059106 [Brassica cretica]